jgi:AcrR family transcriptional regulator
MAEPGTAYEQAKHAARDALRRRLLQVAADRLEAEGFEALSMRPLARAAGCSTMVFYTEFGSKDGLLEAVADDVVGRLLEAVETVADVDLGVHRRAVVRAFLDAVAALPQGYRVAVRAAPTTHGAASGAQARRERLDVRLVSALRPAEDTASALVLRGLVLALHGAADRLVAGHAARQELEPALLALVEASVFGAARAAI